MSSIVGAVVSLAVIAGAIRITCRIRSLLKYLDAKARLLELGCQPAASASPAARRSRFAVVTNFGRRLWPERGVALAGTGLLGVLLTCGLFLAFFEPSQAPAADRPPTPHTVVTTITNQLPAETITRGPDGRVTVGRRTPVAVTPGAVAASGAPAVPATPTPATVTPTAVTPMSRADASPARSASPATSTGVVALGDVSGAVPTSPPVTVPPPPTT